MTKAIRTKPKAITIYITDSQYSQLQELIAYYSQGASKAGLSSVIRYAIDMLYHSMLAELTQKGK